MDATAPVPTITPEWITSFVDHGLYLRGWSVRTYRQGLATIATTPLTKARFAAWVRAMRERGLTPGGINMYEIVPIRRYNPSATEGCMTRLGLLFALTIATGFPLAAKQITSAFEVASVKPNDSGSSRSGTRIPPGGRFEGTNVTLQQLMKVAYSVRDVQIVGGPAWLKSDRFDVIGKIPDGAQPASVPEMVKTLLSERFRLIVHTEAREQPVYALQLARPDRKLGPSLRVTDCVGDRCGNTSTNESNGSGTVSGVSQSMSDIAAWIADRVDRDVLDRTGLAEKYDYDLKYTSARVGAAVPTGDMPPSLFTAIQEQLGLKLEGTRAPVNLIVIDRAEHPTPD